MTNLSIGIYHTINSTGLSEKNHRIYVCAEGWLKWRPEYGCDPVRIVCLPQVSWRLLGVYAGDELPWWRMRLAGWRIWQWRAQCHWMHRWWRHASPAEKAGAERESSYIAKKRGIQRKQTDDRGWAWRRSWQWRTGPVWIWRKSRRSGGGAPWILKPSSSSSSSSSSIEWLLLLCYLRMDICMYID